MTSVINDDLQKIINSYEQVLESFSKASKHEDLYASIKNLVIALKESEKLYLLSDIVTVFPSVDIYKITDQILEVLTCDEVIAAEAYLEGKTEFPQSTPPNSSFIYEELEFLKKYNLIDEQSSIAFVGSGAMPTTAIDLVTAGYHQMDLIDRDDLAIELGKKVVRHFLGHASDKIKFHCMLAQEMDYSNFDVIWIANFIDDKKSCFEKIRQDRKNQPTVILVREAEGIRAIVNKPVDKDDLSSWGTPLCKTPITSTRINTTYIYKI